MTYQPARQTTMVATTALKIPGYARSARNAWTSMGGFKI
jgi:hypothetical protein